MIVMFSARRLKPGAWEQFRQSLGPGGALPPGFQRAYHARNIRDEDEVISFGLFEMAEDEYRRWRAEADTQESQAERAPLGVRRERARLRRLRGDRHPGELASHRLALSRSRSMREGPPRV